MERVEINVEKEIKLMYPKKIIKDLDENEQICTQCHGLGFITIDKVFGHDDSFKKTADMSPHQIQTFTFCPSCTNGVQKICQYCQKPLNSLDFQCDCEKSVKQRENDDFRLHEIVISSAQEISEDEVTTALYCEELDEYYSDLQEYFYNEDFVKFDKEHRPKILWVCDETSIKLDAEYIAENACEELHEDAFEQCDTDNLQELLNEWCSNQTGTVTYHPNNEQYVKIDYSQYDYEKEMKN